MNDNKTIQPKDDKTETDYQPEVSKIAKRGKNQNLFIFLRAASLLGLLSLLFILRIIIVKECFRINLSSC